MRLASVRDGLLSNLIADKSRMDEARKFIGRTTS